MLPPAPPLCSCDADRLSAFDTGLSRYPVFAAWDPEEPRLLAVQAGDSSSPPRPRLPYNNTFPLYSSQTERMRLADSAPGAASASPGATGSPGGGASPAAGAEEDAEGGDGAAGGPRGGASALDSDADEPDSEVISLFATGEADVVVRPPLRPAALSPRLDLCPMLLQVASASSAPAPSSSSAGPAIIQQDSLALEHPYDALLGLGAPYLQLLLRSDALGPGGSHVSLRTMRDYVGLEDSEDATRTWGAPRSVLPPPRVCVPVYCAGRALMDFSFHMATGNMDEAYKAVKLIGNPAVWANMCVL